MQHTNMDGILSTTKTTFTPITLTNTQLTMSKHFLKENLLKTKLSIVYRTKKIITPSGLKVHKNIPLTRVKLKLLSFRLCTILRLIVLSTVEHLVLKVLSIWTENHHLYNNNSKYIPSIKKQIGPSCWKHGYNTAIKVSWFQYFWTNGQH